MLHYSEALLPAIRSGRLSFNQVDRKVTWHDSCHIGRLGPAGGALLQAMKPLFPVLFPLLMPGMMPRVMPDMLEVVGRRVPMPDFMREQMPDLMPRAFGCPVEVRQRQSGCGLRLK